MAGYIGNVQSASLIDNNSVKNAVQNASDSNVFSDADHSKLDGIAAGATVASQPTITVTVAGGKFVIDGTSQQTITMSASGVYKFDQSDSSNASHPLKISTTEDGTHGGGSAITTDFVSVGTAGQAGAYVTFTIQQDGEETYYFYCANHSQMGGEIKKLIVSGGGGEQTFTATGAITAGNPVGFNANGTISAMQQMAGSAAALGSGASAVNSGRKPMAYDTALNKYLHVFIGTNNNMFARVGTVSGFDITFGTAVDSGRTMAWPNRGMLHLVYDDNSGKFVVAYGSTNNYGYASTISISGTTPSFGTEVTVYSGTNYHSAMGYDTNLNKVVFISAGNQDTARARVGTVSGTNISLGTEVNIGGTGLYPIPGSITFDTNVNKFIYAYATGSYGSPYKARTLSISGTSVSAGTEVNLAGGSGDNNKIPTVIFDPSINKGVAFYSNSGSKFKLLTISGTSISQGTETTLALATSPMAVPSGEMYNVCVNPDTAGLIICYSTYPAETRITPAKFSGSNITLSGEIIVSTTKNQGGIIYDPDTDQPIVSTIDEDQIVSLANDGVRPSYVGVAAENISNGATGKVTIIGGVNANQSGLSAGSQYGIPVNSASLVATDISPVGIAISSTEIYLRAVSL